MEFFGKFEKAGMNMTISEPISYECINETGSTNSDLLERIRKEGLSHTVVRRALRQTQGRGTRGRSWNGNVDCLMFSVAIPIGNNLQIMSGITLAIGAHIVLALRKRGINAEVKWPNDILLNGKKLAGILVESAKGPNRQYSLVIGIGFNLKTQNCSSDYGHASLSDVGSPSMNFDAQYWLSILVESILDSVREVKTEGLRPTAALWDKITAYKNQAVLIYEEEGAPYEATLVGIDSKGHLLVRSDNGMKTLISGTISLRLKK